jgi:hypothetical protein
MSATERQKTLTKTKTMNEPTDTENTGAAQSLSRSDLLDIGFEKGDPNKTLKVLHEKDRTFVFGRFFWSSCISGGSYGRLDGHADYLANLYELETGVSVNQCSIEPGLCSSVGGVHGVCISFPNVERDHPACELEISEIFPANRRRKMG